ncbi:MAG: hypothetical protein GQ534_07135 [Candidatus Delongbacteria bacterium]|nr:hypothetical protein [Candidatus Delongbacteria bacterium]
MKKILVLSFLIVLSISPLFSQCMEPSSDDEGVSVMGYIQTQFEYKQSADEDVDAYMGFTFNRARIALLGSIPYDFSYYMVLEFSPFVTEGGLPYLLDGFITYSRLAPYAKISMGQFKSPFSLELNTPCQGLHTIKRSKVVNTLAYPDRDLGILIQGNYDVNDYAKFKYAMSFTNGNGIGEKDNNQNKAFAGRLVYNAMDMISIGGSYKFGKYYNVQTIPVEDEKSRIAGEFEFKGYDILVQAEYIQSEDKGSYTTGGG